MVGAPSPTETGLYYQWGDTIGHSLAEGYNFSLDNYTEKGLDLISSDLDDAHDAARAYYGSVAKMPSKAQFEELVSNCVLSYQGNGVILITSNINGHSIKIRGNGLINGLEHEGGNEIFAWSVKPVDSTFAYILNTRQLSLVVIGDRRYHGCNVMAVHS